VKPDEAGPSRKDVKEDKGKGKETGIDERSNGLSSAGDTSGRASVKRKRLAEEEQIGRSMAIDLEPSKEGGGHKRKRRRKGTATSTGEKSQS
jgi:hypothetical protein